MAKNRGMRNTGKPQITVPSKGGVQIKVIQTTKDGEAILEKSKAEMEQYCNEQKQKADDDAKKVRTEAENDAIKIKEDAEKEAERIKSKASDEVERDIRAEMAEELESAKNEAERILTEASESNREKTEKLDAQLAEVSRERMELTKRLAEEEKTRSQIEKEVHEALDNEIINRRTDGAKLLNELQMLKTECADLQVKVATSDGLLKSYNKIFGDYDKAVSERTDFEFRIKDLELKLESISKLYDDKINENRRLQATIDTYGDDPTKLLKELDESKSEIERLENVISGMITSEDELNKLREINAKYCQLEEKYDVLMKEKIEVEKEKIELSVDQSELANYKRFVKILELQRNELQLELSRTIEMYETRAEKVFANLSEIDGKDVDDSSDGPVDLKTLCTNFRNYLGTRPDNKLYYDDVHIRTFIAGFSASRLMILQGLSGTGKSSLPRAFADYIIGANTTLVPVQSSWKDRNDLLGFYNDFKKQYKETDFLNALYEASHDSNNIHCIVLDEMNLSRIEYYFADMLSVLENPDKNQWDITLISDPEGVGKNYKWPELIHNGKLRICDNTWFIGTANEDDSTQTITDKVYDRSVVINFKTKGKPSEWKSKEKPIRMNNTDFIRSLESVNFSTVDKNRYDKMIETLDYGLMTLFEITFGNRIMDQMSRFVPTYIACGGTVDEAVDVIFSSKILRKLEGVFDENMKVSLGKLRDAIDKSGFIMPLTKEKIARMEKKL